MSVPLKVRSTCIQPFECEKQKRESERKTLRKKAAIRRGVQSIIGGGRNRRRGWGVQKVKTNTSPNRADEGRFF